LRHQLVSAIANASTPHFVYSVATSQLSIPSWRSDRSFLESFDLMKLQKLVKLKLKSSKQDCTAANIWHKPLTILIVDSGQIDRLLVSSADIS
jgi:hypothetical protein